VNSPLIPSECDGEGMPIFLMYRVCEQWISLLIEAHSENCSAAHETAFQLLEVDRKMSEVISCSFLNVKWSGEEVETLPSCTRCHPGARVS
jgi:hypothetical protein